MKKSLKNMIIIAIAIAVLLTIPPSELNKSAHTTSFRSASVGVHVVPIADLGYAPIINKLIENAKSSVYVAMLEMSDEAPVKTLLDSLISASTRGVDVKVLYENSFSENSYAANYLSSNGVTVKEDSSSKFLHTKMLVIDGDIVYIGSHNWSPNALGKNNEYGVLIYNSSIGAFYQAYFNELWNDDSSTPHLALTSISNQGYIVNTTYDWHTYYTITHLLNSARTRLYVAMYDMAYYTNPEDVYQNRVDNMVNDIVAKKSIAKVVLDSGHNYYSYNYLTNNGVAVKYDFSEVITHLKMVIADDSVYIGDTNWNTSYINNDTHTVGIVIHNRTLADYFSSFFTNIYKYRDVPYYLPSPFMDTWNVTVPAGGYAAIHFYLANGGYKNSTYFYIQPNGPLWIDVGKYPSWYRSSVYDWLGETMYVEAPKNSSGTYTESITFYSKDRSIHFTEYFNVSISGSGGTMPVSNHVLISAVYYHTGSMDNRSKYIELYNPTSSKVNLDGYKIVNVSSNSAYTIHGLSILAHSYVSIAISPQGFSAKFHRYPDIGDGTEHGLEIGGTAGGIELLGPENDTVDAVYWGGTNGWDINTSEYTSIVRIPQNWDNDSSAQWVPEQKPVPHVLANASKVILIDGAHDNDYVSKLGAFVVSMRKLGLDPENFTSAFGANSNISSSLLNTSYSALAKLIIITSPARKLSAQELGNISTFMLNFNGSILLTSKSDYYSNGHTTYLNSILHSLGSVLRFNDDEICDNTTNYGANYKVLIHHFNDTSTGITKGVNNVSFYSSASLIDATGNGLHNSEAIILATGDSDTYNENNTAGGAFVSYPKGSYPPVAAAQIIQGHRIAAIGTTVFNDYSLYTYDNLLFTQNIVKWLMGVKAVSMGAPSIHIANSEHENSSVIITVPTANAESVSINYTAANGSYVNTTMYDDGTHGDTSAGDGIYTFTMPNMSANTEVMVKITATGMGSVVDGGFTYYAMPELSWVRNNTGAQVIVEGKVTVKPGSFSYIMYIQDPTAGIRVYGADLSSLGLQYGDYVKVVGQVSSYKEEPEILINSAAQVVKVMHGSPIAPESVSIGTANTTNYGKLVQVTGTVTVINITGHYFYIQDSHDDTIRIQILNTSIDISSLTAGENVVVIGVQSQYNSEMQILPREQSDITSATVPEFGGASILIFCALLIIIYLQRLYRT